MHLKGRCQVATLYDVVDLVKKGVPFPGEENLPEFKTKFAKEPLSHDQHQGSSNTSDSVFVGPVIVDEVLILTSGYRFCDPICDWAAAKNTHRETTPPIGKPPGIALLLFLGKNPGWTRTDFYSLTAQSVSLGTNFHDLQISKARPGGKQTPNKKSITFMKEFLISIIGPDQANQMGVGFRKK
ncbi:MAG: hypothetical protein CM15mP49_26230 [Actinomycetota bacterium]|nr:MAG: hypothetical protein CM15mP49_26230 [Actinomycetota bacterium]